MHQGVEPIHGFHSHSSPCDPFQLPEQMGFREKRCQPQREACKHPGPDGPAQGLILFQFWDALKGAKVWPTNDSGMDSSPS
jgi:hypothetical protein